ncbi:hypothetical protein [Streptosporangium canum]|uniref:hypothetical protein n=1 Tax=Streptosporangium canum TaxID=324952 RepID=UPI0037BCE09E
MNRADRMPTRVQLPHTGLQVPHRKLHVARCRNHWAKGWEYRALLVLGEQHVGQVRGRALSGPGHSSIATGEELVVSFHPRGEAFTDEDLTLFSAGCLLDGRPVTPGRVLALLVEEHQVDQMVRGCARRGGAMARVAQDGLIHYIPLRTCPRTPQQRAVALAHLQRASGVRGPWLIWARDHWQLLAAPISRAAPLPGPP